MKETKKRPSHWFTSEQAKELQAKSVKAKLAKKAQAEAKALELRALAHLTPRERMRVAASEEYGAWLERWRELLAGSDPQVAHRAYLDVVEQAHGKTPATLEVKAGPIDAATVREASVEELRAQAEEIRGRLALEAGSGQQGG